MPIDTYLINHISIEPSVDFSPDVGGADWDCGVRAGQQPALAPQSLAVSLAYGAVVDTASLLTVC